MQLNVLKSFIVELHQPRKNSPLAVFQPNNMKGKCLTSFLDNSSVCMQLVWACLPRLSFLTNWLEGKS
jgi:hypothetical protein